MSENDFFERVTDTFYSATDAASKKAKQLSEVARLNYENAQHRDQMKKAYLAIGKKYFAEISAEPPEDYEVEVAMVRAAQATIAKNKERIAELKKKEEEKQ